MAEGPSRKRRLVDGWRRRWPTVRAVLVLLHVICLIVFALPLPDHAIHDVWWQTPDILSEIDAWAETVRSIGIPVSNERFREIARGTAEGYVTVRGYVRAPYEPYIRFAGTRQSWSMFGAPSRFAVRMTRRAISPRLAMRMRISRSPHIR